MSAGDLGTDPCETGSHLSQAPHMASIQPEDNKKALKSMFQSLLNLFFLIYSSLGLQVVQDEQEESECERNKNGAVGSSVSMTAACVTKHGPLG